MPTDALYSMKNVDTQQYTDQFMEYYEKYSDDIFRFCMVKTRNRDRSLDITQETFLKFWEYIIKGKDIENERPLLYKIANNMIIDFYRKKKAIQVEDFSEGSYNDYLHDDEQEERMSNKIDGQKAVASGGCIPFQRFRRAAGQRKKGTGTLRRNGIRPVL